MAPWTLKLSPTADALRVELAGGAVVMDAATVETFAVELATARALMMPRRAGTLFAGTRNLVHGDADLHAVGKDGIVTIGVAHPGLPLVGMDCSIEDARLFIAMLTKAIADAGG